MTMILDLPRDLLEEILSRLPLKSMRVVRLTCTKWNALSKSDNFMKMHMAKATREGQSQMIVMMDYNIFLIDHHHPSTGKLTCLDQQVKVSQVFHCQGLLLCILKDSFNLVVWNPYLGQTRRIKPRYTHPSPDGYSYYALGYKKKNKSCRSYKVLVFIDQNLSNCKRETCSWYEVYDFDSDLWTTHDVTLNWDLALWKWGVSLNGNTYWCATNRDSRHEYNDHIICFDFTRERFGPLIRLPFSAGFMDYVSLSCVRQEKLAVLLEHNASYEIWVTTKIEDHNIWWTKFLMEPKYPITPGSFFLDEEKKLVMGFYQNFYSANRYMFTIIGEARNWEFDLGERTNKTCLAQACSFVPSLVKIKQLKRKRQSSLVDQTALEKLQYGSIDV